MENGVVGENVLEPGGGLFFGVGIGLRLGRAGNRDFAAQPKGGIGLPLSLEEDGFGLLLQFDWFVENDLAIDARLDIGCARFSGMAEFDGEVNERLVA